MRTTLPACCAWADAQAKRMAQRVRTTIFLFMSISATSRSLLARSYFDQPYPSYQHVGCIDQSENNRIDCARPSEGGVTKSTSGATAESPISLKNAVNRSASRILQRIHACKRADLIGCLHIASSVLNLTFKTDRQRSIEIEGELRRPQQKRRPERYETVRAFVNQSLLPA
jgi:hypothetical protein